MSKDPDPDAHQDEPASFDQQHDPPEPPHKDKQDPEATRESEAHKEK